MKENNFLYVLWGADNMKEGRKEVMKNGFSKIYFSNIHTSIKDVFGNLKPILHYITKNLNKGTPKQNITDGEKLAIKQLAKTKT